MEFKDYYRIMQLEESASPDAVKKAYRKLARKYHPDVSKEADAEKKFKDLGEAYEVLRDENKRREYDELRRMERSGRGGHFRAPPRGGAGFQNNGEYSAANFSDFFDNLFGQRGAHAYAEQPMHGEDVHYELALLLEEAFHGCEQVVELRIPQIDAGGRRRIGTRKLKIKVPAGMTTGSLLRLKGQGAPGFGGAEAGDLLVTIRLAGHPLYTVDGRDIALVVPVAPWEAALGCTLEVPTLGGKVRITVPAQSQSGTKLRLAGKGMPGTPAGDFFVVLKVVMPDRITDKARELYRQLEHEVGFNPRQALEDRK